MDFVMIAGLALTAVGFMEYLKGFVPVDQRDKVPSWLYRVILCLVSAGVAISNGGEIGTIILNGIAITGFAQIGYDKLVAKIKDQIK